MTLILDHPEVAFRDCNDCKRWLYDEQTGERALRWGKPIPRPPKPGPPCVAHRCPKGSPEADSSLSIQNLVAYRHYRECRATGHFPDDPLVARNAGIIQRVEDIHSRKREARLFGSFVGRLARGR